MIQFVKNFIHAHIRLIAISTILLVMIFAPFPEKMKEITSLPKLHAYNETTLKIASESNQKEIEFLSEILIVNKVLASTKIGINFLVNTNVNVGEIISELKKFLQKAFTITTIAAALLKFLSTLISLAALLAPLFFKLSLGSVLLLMISAYVLKSAKIHDTLIELSKKMCTLFVFTWLIIPLSIGATGWLTTKLELYSHLHHRLELVALTETVSDLHDNSDTLAHWVKISTLKQGFSEFTSSAHRSSANYIEYLAGLILFHGLHGIVFPIMASLFLYKILQVVSRRMFNFQIPDLENRSL